jgi:transposase InsO family protein
MRSELREVQEERLTIFKKITWEVHYERIKISNGYGTYALYEFNGWGL